ncbi:MAG: PHP domain-containing protein [Ruminococcaceae bacterium]|nr:PHP domain-containing protein [Oscillospiraceae bacterium]
MKYANLHLHSNHSDAQFSPEQLVLLGKSLGYYALALTDHETDSGVKSMMSYAKKQGGIDVISGVEFYGKHENASLHLTALDFDMDNPEIREFIKARVDARVECTRKCVELGIKNGVIDGITWDDVVKYNPDGAWLCIDSVMNAYRALKLQIPDNLREAVFKTPEAKSFSPAKPTAEEVIKVVRKAGGVIALAHPYHWTKYVPKLYEYGLNGIEVSHPDNYENTSFLALEAAKTYNLYHCGGTDHTGVMSGCDGVYATSALQGITEEEYFTLKERRKG